MYDKLDDVVSTLQYYDAAGLIQSSPSQVEVSHVRCRTPGGQILFRDLSFKLQRGESMLIMGPSGAGKQRCGCSVVPH